jgi:hypothetical protein
MESLLHILSGIINPHSPNAIFELRPCPSDMLLGREITDDAYNVDRISIVGKHLIRLAPINSIRHVVIYFSRWSIEVDCFCNDPCESPFIQFKLYGSEEIVVTQ